MRIEHISSLQALSFLACILLLAYGLYRVVPGTGLRPGRTSFSSAEIREYDPALPKHVLAAALALAVGAVHAVVKNLPPVEHWLADGGHGGHLVRDMANTHLNIVIGGTVAATGLTWYVLPRILRRPLASRRLATVAFWATTLGAAGFYLSNLVLGVVLARLHHDGVPYAEGKEMLGAWRAVPISLTATVMGIGYWTFVANVLLTVFAGRRIAAQRPSLHLAKFFVVGALGLTVGTVQGVIQVMPDNEAWLHAAGPAGQYIDPVAHAHVNLVTGTLMLIAGLVFWWTRREGTRRRDRRVENVVFWAMLIGSGGFYAAFMRVGWVEGHLMTERGLTWEQAVDQLGLWHTLPLALSGAAMLAGLWSLLAAVVERCVQGRVPGPTGVLLLVGSGALLVGSLQGIVQVIPAAKRWLELSGEHGEALVNAHAQLNMLGGVILMLFALALDRGEVMVGAQVPARVPQALARWSAPGIAIYYLSAVAGLLAAGQAVVAQGGAAEQPGQVHDHVTAASGAGGLVVDVLFPLGTAAGAALYAVGFIVVSRFTWTATRAVRAEGWAQLLDWVDRYQGERPAWAARIPRRYYLYAELPGACSGFPGIGWLFSRRPLVGLPLALLNPAVVWGLLPVLTLDATGRWLPFTLGWIIVSGALSLGLLAILELRPATGVRAASRRPPGQRGPVLVAPEAVPAARAPAGSP